VFGSGVVKQVFLNFHYLTSMLELKTLKPPAGPPRQIAWAIEKLLSNRLWASAFLTITIIVVYWPVFNHQFQVQWDDQWVVINKYTSAGLHPENLWRVLTDFWGGQYAPVNELFYILIYTFVKYDPFWFHTACLAVHVINVLLVYHLFLKLLPRTTQFTASSVQRISLFTALLMAVHRFLVESVAWISASKNSLYTLFYLVALHAWLSYTKEFRFKYYLLTICWFFISFGAKEQAVTLPIGLLLLDYALDRNMLARRLWLEKIPFFLLSLIFGIITFYSQAANKEGILSDEPLYPFYQNIAFAGYAISEYFTKCLAPVNLSHFYPFPNAIGQPVPMRFWFYPVAVAFALVFLWINRNKKWITWSAAFFLVHIVIASNAIPLSRNAIVADRYVYLASIGIFFCMAYLLNNLFLQKTAYRKIIAGIAILYVLLLTVYAHNRSKVWYDSDTLKYDLRQLLNSKNVSSNEKK